MKPPSRRFSESRIEVGQKSETSERRIGESHFSHRRECPEVGGGLMFNFFSSTLMLARGEDKKVGVFCPFPIFVDFKWP
jgi:hypothetical protein